MRTCRPSFATHRPWRLVRSDFVRGELSCGDRRRHSELRSWCRARRRRNSRSSHPAPWIRCSCRGCGGASTGVPSATPMPHQRYAPCWPVHLDAWSCVDVTDAVRCVYQELATSAEEALARLGSARRAGEHTVQLMRRVVASLPHSAGTLPARLSPQRHEVRWPARIDAAAWGGGGTRGR